MARKILTPEERKEAYIRKKERELKKHRNETQKRYEDAKRRGSPDILTCECGRLFDRRLNGNIRPGIVYFRERCYKCPLRPKERVRKFYSKKENRWKEYICKN